jgi:hypothetical protein
LLAGQVQLIDTDRDKTLHSSFTKRDIIHSKSHQTQLYLAS